MDDQLLQKIKTAQKRAGISGWLEDWDIRHLYDAISAIGSGGVYLEIGVAHGQSMSIACVAAKQGVHLYGIDVIEWEDKDKAIESVVQDVNDGKGVGWKFIEGESQLWARYWKEMIDVLFIDGDHTYQGVIKDIASWIPWVKSGGTVLFDDFNEKTDVKDAIQEILWEHKRFTYEIDNEMYICRKL